MTHMTQAAPRASLLFSTADLGLGQLVATYQTLKRRKALQALSDRQLEDIGVVRADINVMRASV